MAYDSKLKQITVCYKNGVNTVINTIWSLTPCRSLLLLSGYTLCSHTSSVWTPNPLPLFQINHTFIDIACLVYYAYALSPVLFCYHLYSLPLRCRGASFFFSPIKYEYKAICSYKWSGVLRRKGSWIINFFCMLVADRKIKCLHLGNQVRSLGNTLHAENELFILR